MVKVEIIKVSDTNSLKTFINVPHSIYKNDPNYVPELYIQTKQLLNKNKNPFFEHASADYFIAIKNNKAVGRIAAIKDDNFISFTRTKTGIFGFFESINETDVAHKLLQAAVDWAKHHNLNNIIGPSNLSTNNTSFLLIDGYDKPPCVMMAYNKPYYKNLLETFGFVKKIDTFAYSMPKSAIYNERFQKIRKLGAVVEKRLNAKDIFLRNINIKDFANELKLVKYIYNKAWEKNMDFVPMTDNEFSQLAKELKLIINPKHTLLAFHNDKPIGVSISIPDINQKLKKIKNGKLFPTGIFHLLNISSIKHFRVIIQGVLQEYRHLGIDAYFIYYLLKEAEKKNVEHIELSWILENNYPVINMFSNMQLEIYKKYRLYQKNILKFVEKS